MTEVLRLSLGDRLRRERERRHWTQEYLAAQIGGSALSILRWEKGQARPRADMLKALVDLFGKPIEMWGASQAHVWTVPYLRNLYFTGREHILARLHAVLSGEQIVAVSQTRAISGLGGIGKTQTALEYAYRYADEYDLVLWVRADSREALVGQLAGLATHFGLSNYAEADQQRLAQAVKRWLETQEEQVWLLIFDNVDDIPLVTEFLPTRGNGAVLLTTRLHAVGKHMRRIELDKLSLEEGMQFLLGRMGSAGEQGWEAFPETERQAAEQLCGLLDGLPLALDQAAAYIEEHGCSLAEYVALYQQQRATFLRLGNSVDRQDYPDSVATTWLLSFQRMKAQHPAAAELLRLCAYLAPDTIPEELLTKGAASLGPILAPVAAIGSELNCAIEALRAYSLVQRNPQERTFSIHRLVQVVIQDAQEEAEQRLWAQRAMLAVNAAFPQVAPETWPQCERLLTQAVHVTQVIEQHQTIGEEAGRLLFETASYLQYRGRFAEAEPLYLRVLHLCEQQAGPEHPQVATLLNSLGIFYREQGKYAEAEPLSRQALHIWEQQAQPEPAQVVIALNNLAILYTSRGRYAEAEPLYLRALAMCEQQLGMSHCDTARTLSNVGNLYSFQGRYTEAEPLYSRALGIYEQQLGPENSRLAYPLHGLAALSHYQGKHTESEQLYLRALAIREQQLGPEHPQMTYLLNGLASLYHEQGKYAKAEPLYLRALRIWEEQVGPAHPESAYPLTALATLYARQGRYGEAEPLYQRALRIWEGQFGPECLQTAETLRALAELQEAQGHHEEARRRYERAQALREQALGASHPQTTEIRHLIALLRAMGQHDEAARLEAAQVGQKARKEEG